MKKMYIDVVHIYMFFFFQIGWMVRKLWSKVYKYVSFRWWGVYWQTFWSFPTFLNHFTPIWLKITHNCKFCQKSWLDWVKTAKFGYFAYFLSFPPKWRLRLTRNGQFHPIHNFSHLLPPKHIIFGEISKIFISGGGVHQQIFWVFQLFQIVSHQYGWKWPTMANLAKKVA